MEGGCGGALKQEEASFLFLQEASGQRSLRGQPACWVEQHDGDETTAGVRQHDVGIILS